MKKEAKLYKPLMTHYCCYAETKLEIRQCMGFNSMAMIKDI